LNELKPVVLDTNIVLDMFVFNDAGAASLTNKLAAGGFQWIATPAMRDELARVLAYSHIDAKLAFYEISSAAVMAQFDRWAQLEPVAAKAPVTCKDPDDQKFIDLAVARRATLVSKDNAVLCMAKRLLALDVPVTAQVQK
jgi:putative PIN family toxin of toxin-antitoxin system